MHLLCSSFCVHPQIHSLSSLTLFCVWGGPCSLASSCFWLAGSGTVRNSGLDYLPPSLFRPQRTIRHLQVSWFPLCTRKSLSTMVFSCFYFVDPPGQQVLSHLPNETDLNSTLRFPSGCQDASLQRGQSGRLRSVLSLSIVYCWQPLPIRYVNCWLWDGTLSPIKLTFKKLATGFPNEVVCFFFLIPYF